MTRAPAPNSLLRRGEARLAAGDLAGARALLDRAVARDPHNAEGFAARGEVLRQQGELAAARADFERALVLRPGYAWALASRGLTLLQSGDPAAALADLDHALASEEDIAWAVLHRGQALARLGRHAEARAAFEQAVALDGNDLEARLGWADAARVLGDLDEALAEYHRIANAEPGRALPRARIAEIHHRRGESAAMVAALVEVFRLPIQHAEDFFARAIALRLEGDVSASVKFMSQARMRGWAGDSAQ